MTQILVNNALTTLASAAAAGDTTLLLTAGAAFGSPSSTSPIIVTLTDGTNYEIVKCTVRSTNTLTVTRAQESTTARAWDAGAQVFAGLTAGVVEAIRTLTPNATQNTVQAGYLASGGDTQESGVVLGRQASISAGLAVAVGAYSSAAFVGTALGYYSASTGNYSLALGYSPDAVGAYSVALGKSAEAYGDYSVAWGGCVARPDHALAHGTYPVVVNDDWYDGGGEYKMNGMETVITASAFDFAGGATWAASTSYTHGDVVHPTTPNGKQYRLYAYRNNFAAATLTSGATQPTWPTTVGDSVSANPAAEGDWICIDPATAGITHTFPAGMTFYPSEVVVVIDAVAGLSANPVFSVGDSGSATKYLANQTLSGITGNQQRVKYDLSGMQAGCTNLKFTLNTAATATRMLGRILVKGLFVEDQGNTA